MARATFVKAARKDNPVAKKGEPYYWWKFMQGGRGGPKRYSATPPTRSQLTQSDFLGSLYRIEDESFKGVEDAEGLKAVAEEIRELGTEQQEKYDNMPEGLQQGDTGQTIEERAQNCESWADEIDSIADTLETELEAIETLEGEWADYDSAMEEHDEDDDDAEEPEEPSEERPGDDARTELISEKVMEAQGASPF